MTIKKLEGREKILWLTIANKVNEMIDELEKLEQKLNSLEKPIPENTKSEEMKP